MWGKYIAQLWQSQLAAIIAGSTGIRGIIAWLSEIVTYAKAGWILCVGNESPVSDKAIVPCICHPFVTPVASRFPAQRTSKAESFLMS